jgi:hypothetical protein
MSLIMSVSSKERYACIWNVCVLRMGQKSETHSTYVCLQLDQIRDAPIFLLKIDEHSWMRVTD